MNAFLGDRPMGPVERLLLFLGSLLLCLFYVLVFTRMEVARRARWAFEKAEQHRSWAQHSEAKESQGRQMMRSGSWTRTQYALAMADSDLKNARIWYETVVDLYSSPEGEWKSKALQGLREMRDPP